MPERADPPAGLDEVADRLYGLPPGDFVEARDEAVARARADGDRELARAIGKLRRPTRAAWLANLLARHRAEQVEGLAGLAAGLADAQRSLDGPALRELSSRRHRLVAAMARDAGRLAREAGDPAGEPVLRELQGILEAALARPEVAAEVRAGRLTRAISYSGFGPESDADAWAVPPPRPAPARAAPADDEADDDATTADRDRAAERERAEAAKRRAAAEREVADAEREAADARDRQEDAEAARDAARERHEAVKERIAELTAELDRARDDERAGGAEVRAATAAARDAVRAAGAAAARAERARARLADL